MLFLGTLVALSAPCFALDAGLINDFEDNTVQGWGHPRTNNFEPTVNVDSSTNNHSLSIIASGQSGAGSRLLALNRSAVWTSPVSSDLIAITAHLTWKAGPDLSVRFAFLGTDDTQSNATWYVSTTPVVITDANPTVSQATFPFEDLLRVSGTAGLSEVMNNIQEVRILHSAAPSFKGDITAGSFLVDNISTVATPASSESIPVPAIAVAGLAFVFGLIARKHLQ